ncbi:MAG: hypothetical protein V3S46_00725, partial [Nitrospinota bacterium]
MNGSQIKRLQGTDGVRGRVAPSSGLSGSPLEVFLDGNLITEEFFELYCYAHVSDLIERGKAESGGRFLVGWDSRDKENFYTDAAVRGIAKAGGKPVVLGTIPTPGVALSLVSMKAAGAFMITASHNPKDHNGIKIFLAPDAMKMLPEDDEALTRKIIETDYGEVKKKTPVFEPLNAKNEAAELFKKFHLDPVNSWAADKNIFAKTVLIVDPAHGAMAGIAAEVFSKLGFSEIIEVAGDQNGNVNENSGVADLEGIKGIGWHDMRERPALAKHKLIANLFAYGQSVKEKIVKGELFLTGVTFDADGDRFFILLYDAVADHVHVLSGDECAALKAGYVMETFPEKYRDTMFVHTVESDINVARYIRSLGMNPVVEAVGDKWILKMAMENGEGFGIGVEESGHSITRGVVRTETGERGFYTGNGLKGAINTLVAIHARRQESGQAFTLKSVVEPFSPGYKSTLYSYFVKRELFTRDSGTWNGVLKKVEDSFATTSSGASGAGSGLVLVQTEIENERDMLYLSILEKDGEVAVSVASVFIRNSGTEDKIGVNARGPHELQNLLDGITAEA